MTAVLSDPRAFRAGLASLLLLASAAAAPAREGRQHHRPSPPAATAVPTPAEQSFLAENDSAMARMMDAMAVRPGGGIDRDFVAMMTAHHQGAIDMAVTLLRHGGDERLRRLAQEIIVTQGQEIAAMRAAIGAPLPPSAPVPTQVRHAPAIAAQPQGAPP